MEPENQKRHAWHTFLELVNFFRWNPYILSEPTLREHENVSNFQCNTGSFHISYLKPNCEQAKSPLLINLTRIGFQKDWRLYVYLEVMNLCFLQMLYLDETMERIKVSMKSNFSSQMSEKMQRFKISYWSFAIFVMKIFT